MSTHACVLARAHCLRDTVGLGLGLGLALTLTLTLTPFAASTPLLSASLQTAVRDYVRFIPGTRKVKGS